MSIAARTILLLAMLLPLGFAAVSLPRLLNVGGEPAPEVQGVAATAVPDALDTRPRPLVTRRPSATTGAELTPNAPRTAAATRSAATRATVAPAETPVTLAPPAPAAAAGAEAGAEAPPPSADGPAPPRLQATPTRAPAVPEGAAVVGRTGPSDPAGTVIGFYQSITRRQFDQAAQYWSPRMRAQYPPNENIAGRFAATQQITVQRADVVALDEAAGQATVAVELVEVSGSPPRSRRLSGSWQLVRGASGWQLDRPRF